ncbi:peptidase S8 [Catenulispora yoronensis]|uniref:Peptidase S8 n=1 Tax=Catenulispora yoronensis TaxID=450799 RepID=A0ABN2UAX6_9ACTN
MNPTDSRTPAKPVRTRLRLLTVLAAVTALAAGFATTASAVNTTAGAKGGPGKGNTAKVCGTAKAHQVRCFAELRTDVRGGKGVRGAAAAAAGKGPAAAALPQGLGPADLHAAYKLPTTGGANQTVAIVDAGDDPTAEADLAVYRSTYGLPPCTTANGCFKKVNERGAATPLPQDMGWGVEIALDLDMVSAACPQCKILLVEGDQPTMDDLGASVNTAVALGATEVSNSYGGTEGGDVLSGAAYYTHPGVAIVASSGDYGYGVPSAPAVYPSVVSVGGTSLTKAAGTARGWTESAWIGAGSGCSAWIDKPAWQHDANCPGRMVADVAADADPQTGPAVYGTTDGLTGWGVVGGTSASSPFLAGVIGLAGNPQKFPNASAFYTNHSALFDVTSGNNITGIECGGDYQCNGVAGYDGPTGWGTPNGIGGF